MRIIFRTNVDKYQMNIWPTNLIMVPRIGEMVMVNKVYRDQYQRLRLPTRMVVSNVIWSEDEVVCELWYHENDIAMAEISGVKLL